MGVRRSRIRRELREKSSRHFGSLERAVALQEEVLRISAHRKAGFEEGVSKTRKEILDFIRGENFPPKLPKSQWHKLRVNAND